MKTFELVKLRMYLAEVLVVSGLWLQTQSIHGLQIWSGLTVALRYHNQTQWYVRPC